MVGTKGIPVRAFAIYLLAAVIGVAGGLLGSGFQLGLNELQQLLTGQHAVEMAAPGSSPQLLIPRMPPWKDLADTQKTIHVMEPLSHAVHRLPVWRVLAVPTLGGLVAGLILLLLKRKAPFGITDIIGMVQLRRGTIRLRDSALQILSAACTIGSGGSIGREGANSHIAATVASWLTSRLQIGSRGRSVLLGCGVAAGMATSYNSPIAGAIFVMEAVLGNFAMDVFAPIVVSAVLATMLRHVLMGEGAVYADVLPRTLPVLSWNLVLAALALGVACGVGGILFRKSLRIGRAVMTWPKLPVPLTMALGGLVVGVIGIWLPETWGNGIEVIKTIARDMPPLTLIAALFFWKVVATAATVGSGGLGGIFTPNLVIGAAFGGFFAYGIRACGMETIHESEVAIFAFVGMAGLTAATMHAPVTSVVLVFELTGHYELTLPVMLCSITASIVASLIDEDSIYSAALKAKGEVVPTGLEELAIRTTFVRDVMRKDVLTVRDIASFDEVMDVLANHRGDTVYVLDAEGSVCGRIQLQDVKNFINDPTLSSLVIANDLTRPIVSITPEDSLAAVLPRFDDPELGEIAVVRAGTRTLIGRVRQQDVISGIRSEVLGQQRRARFQDKQGATPHMVELPAGWELETIVVPAEWHGLSIDNLPPDVLTWLAPVLVTLETPEQGFVRAPATQELVVHTGQQLLALCRTEDLQRWRSGSTQV